MFLCNERVDRLSFKEKGSDLRTHLKDFLLQAVYIKNGIENSTLSSGVCVSFSNFRTKAIIVCEFNSD